MKQKEKATTSKLNKRTKADNKRTINRLLNLYDIMLEEHTEMIQDHHYDDTFTYADKLNMFKTLVSMINPLMQRWNIIHQGYDTNARIIEAKQKAKLEKKTAEPELMVVAHYHPSMKELWDNLPKKDGEENENGIIHLMEDELKSIAKMPDT